LAGYQQLQAIQQALAPLPALDSSGYFQRLLFQVKRALDNNRDDARNLDEAHRWLLQIADCLNYPPNSPAHRDRHFTGHQVAANMEALINSFRYSKTQRPQSVLFSGLRKRWRLHQHELLPCYDIPGLPQDNSQLESLFEHLRRRQRRTSGRKSTRELRDFAQAQILFQAQSEASLLEQIRQVPLADYYSWQSRLRLAESPRQFIQALHHNASATMDRLVKQYLSTCASPATGNSSNQLSVPP
jgi:hypothetical protein